MFLFYGLEDSLCILRISLICDGNCCQTWIFLTIEVKQQGIHSVDGCQTCPKRIDQVQPKLPCGVHFNYLYTWMVERSGFQMIKTQSSLNG